MTISFPWTSRSTERTVTYFTPGRQSLGESTGRAGGLPVVSYQSASTVPPVNCILPGV
jgi:hypothetical protein